MFLLHHMDSATTVGLRNFFQFLYLFGVVILLSSRHILSDEHPRVILEHLSEVEGGGRRIRCSEPERRALLELKNVLVDEHTRLSSWSTDDCCEWAGVRCDKQSNHVTELDLRGPNTEYLYRSSAPLKGALSSSLLELPYLNYLDLSYNDFNLSSIPSFIGSLCQLQYLNLSFAGFKGSIPQQLGNLSKLQFLDLRHIQYLYSDNLDWLSRLRSLKYVDLSFIDISKATNWMEAISKLGSIKEIHMRECYPSKIHPYSLPLINVSTSLAILDLSGNIFTRDELFPSMFSWLLNFTSSLTSIDLSNNNLTGPFPEDFEKMKLLSHLDLSYCYLEGGVPKYLGNISNLVYLNLMSNSLTGQLFELVMNLSGNVQSKLQSLDLSRNMLTGAVPDMSMFPSLVELKLGNNKLNESIPEGYLRLPFLAVLDLSSNTITGLVPRDLSFSPSLKELYLNDNLLNGVLFKGIGDLSELEILCLGSNDLEGTITEAMLRFPRLRVLDLGSNSFLVKISPSWLPPFQLTYLSLVHCDIGPYFPIWLRVQKELVYLDISHTKITDTIPSWFGDASRKLVHFNASNNQIYGVIPDISLSNFNFSSNSPPPIPASGVRLDLSSNKLSGSVIFLCRVVFWWVIDLSNNLFSGQIPDCFDKFDRLVYMNLADNRFSGNIPDSFGSLRALSLLQLRNNSFSGEIPASMRHCTSLGMIDLGQNKLSGRIPPWIGENLSRLVVLSLSSNQFNGTIPSSLCHLTDIQILDLSSNNISGIIPQCLYNLTFMTVKWQRPSLLLFVYNPGWDLASLTNGIAPQRDSLASASLMWKGKEVKYINNLGLVKLIDFSSNGMSGEIPSEMAKLFGLIGLNLSRNSLVGRIPRDIGQLEFLNFLDLSRNGLVGEIPASLAELGHLGVLDLSWNNLLGRIPSTGQMLTFNGSEFTGNAGLCGQQILKSCPGDGTYNNEEPKFGGDDSNLDEDHEDDKYITKGFYIALVLGFPLGFWGIVLKLRIFQGV